MSFKFFKHLLNNIILSSILKVLIINNNLNYIFNTFKIIIIILKSFYNYKKFFIISIIITFNFNKFLRLKYY